MKTHGNLLIKHADYVDENFNLVKGKSILIQNGVIQAIDTLPALEQSYTWDTALDGSGCVYMPGLVDAHMHTGQQLLRGRVLDEMPMIWTRIMLPFESTLTPEKMRLSAQLAAWDMIRCGTTGFIDAGSYYMEEAAAVYQETGLRGALSYSTMDQKGLPASIAMDARQAVEKTDRLYEAFHGKGNLKVYYSLRSLISCSRELMEAAGARAVEKDTFLQAHMNEYPGEINFFMEKEHMRPYEYLDSLGILNDRFLGAHSLLLSENEKELLADRGTLVCHCPFSNCGKAAPDTPSLLEKGIPTALGTDGAAHGGLSLWSEMKLFRSVMNLKWGVPVANPAVMPAKTILKMVTANGQRCLGNPLGGMIAPGYRADLIGIDLTSPHLALYGQLSNTLLESVDAPDVRDSIVGGKILMKNREIQVLDRERILYEASRCQEDYHL